MKTKTKTKSELRKFGLVVSVPFALLGAYLIWKQNTSAFYLFGIAAYFSISALILPNSLRLTEKAWMKMAEILSAIMTRVILVLAFILVITPFGLFLRLLGKDLLGLKIEKNRSSYWTPVEEDGPQTRPQKPF